MCTITVIPLTMWHEESERRRSGSHWVRPQDKAAHQLPWHCKRMPQHQRDGRQTESRRNKGNRHRLVKLTEQEAIIPSSLGEREECHFPLQI